MNATTLPSPAIGLSTLDRLALSPHYQRWFDEASKTCGGNAMWAARKLAEVREFLALAQLSQRIKVHWIDLTDEFRVLFDLRVPVATRPDPTADIRVVPFATLGLRYRAEALALPQPGYSFVQLLMPTHAWYSNVLPELGQPICLGPSMPAGVRVRELVVLAYLSLSLQSTQLNPGDSAGLFRAEVAQWWQLNLSRLPLTRSPFLGREGETVKPRAANSGHTHEKSAAS
jgi:hypothetical protein